MSEHNDSPDMRRIVGGLLLYLGRLIFAVATIFLCTHLLFGTPRQFVRIGVGLAVATLLLISAACLVRDFRWLWRVPVTGVAIAGVVIAGAIFTLYFCRQPHSLNSYEFGIAVIGIIVFAGSLVLLRRCRRVYGRV